MCRHVKSRTCPSSVTFIFPPAVLQEWSGRVRRPIAIWPGNTKSQMKRRWGSCKSHITKKPVKAQEHCSAATLYLAACLQSRPRQEAVIAISCLCHSGDDGTTEVWRKNHIFLMFAFVCPKATWIHSGQAHDCFSEVDDKRLQSIMNPIGRDVNSGRDKTLP